MIEFARFPLDQGGTVMVELEETPGINKAGLERRVINDALVSFEKAFAGVRSAAAAALTQFREMSRQPDQVEISFGVRLDAQAGAVIARTGVQGHFTVTLRWQSPDPTESSPAATAGGESTAG